MTTQKKRKSCDRPCGPGDYYKGGKCDLHGCYREEEKEFVQVGTVNGVNIYREPNAAGGHTYYADDIGGGRVCYDTCLADDEIIAFCQADRRKVEKNSPPLPQPVETQEDKIAFYEYGQQLGIPINDLQRLRTKFYTILKR